MKDLFREWRLIGAWAVALLIVGTVVYFGTRPFPANRVNASDVSDVGSGSIRVIPNPAAPAQTTGPAVALAATTPTPFICPDRAPLSGVASIQLSAAYAGRDLVLTVTDQRNRRLMCAQFTPADSGNTILIIGPADEHGQIVLPAALLKNVNYVRGHLGYYDQAGVVYDIPITH